MLKNQIEEVLDEGDLIPSQGVSPDRRTKASDNTPKLFAKPYSSCRQSSATGNLESRHDNFSSAVMPLSKLIKGPSRRKTINPIVRDEPKTNMADYLSATIKANRVVEKSES